VAIIAATVVLDRIVAGSKLDHIVGTETSHSVLAIYTIAALFPFLSSDVVARDVA
jgi:hypothetical protein